MAKTWKHAVVGCGVIGEWHLSVLDFLPHSEIVAACDVEPAQSEKCLQKAGVAGRVPTYTRLAELLDKHADTEVVHVCTPSGDHHPVAVEAMRAGKHVICEKPLDITLDKIDLMNRVADESGVKLAGIFQNRYRGEMAALRKASVEKRFGTLAFAGCYTPWWRTDAYYESGGWRGTWALDGGGAIMNQSVHGVDLLQWIAGGVKTVSAHASTRVHRAIEVEDTLACALTFDGGAHGVLMGSTAMYPGSSVRFEIGGDDGSAFVGYGSAEVRFRHPRDGDDDAFRERGADVSEADKSTYGGGANPSDVPQYLHARNIADILHCWERGDDPMTSGREARKAVAIIVAMYESARRGGEPVEVDRGA